MKRLRMPLVDRRNRFRGDKAKVRRIAVAPGNSQACVDHTLKNVQNRTYPLFHEQYFYVNVKLGSKGSRWSRSSCATC
jgi:hypothetical protein